MPLLETLKRLGAITELRNGYAKHELFPVSIIKINSRKCGSFSMCAKLKKNPTYVKCMRKAMWCKSILYNWPSWPQTWVVHCRKRKYYAFELVEIVRILAFIVNFPLTVCFHYLYSPNYQSFLFHMLTQLGHARKN